MFVNFVVGDIAAAASSDEDFDANLFGAVEEDDSGVLGIVPCVFDCSCYGDGGHQTRCTGSDDGDLSGFGGRVRWHESTPRRIRTFDLRIRSPLLYPAELSGLRFGRRLHVRCRRSSIGA